MIKIQKKPMGAYQTNCYIVTKNAQDIIIDPGIDATDWVVQNVTNPIAILNTHGHFDHVWSNHALKEKFHIPIYIPKEDAFMLKDDPFGQGTPPSVADVEINGDSEFTLGEFEIIYRHFPGHTPGCSVIEIEDHMFSGDFVFKNSIGRVDFPYSNPQDMKKSIKKFLTYQKDMLIHPGHGEDSTVKAEQKTIANWLNYI